MYEKVNPAHPDKIADRIAGALVDLAYAKADNPKIAVEVLIGHGVCHIIAETSKHFTLAEVLSVVERIAGPLEVDYQEVAQDVHLAANQNRHIRCGDNGIFKGTPVTDEQRELATVAERLYDKYLCDGKYIQTNGHLIICQSNAATSELCRLFPRAEINPLGDWTGGTDVDTGATNRKLGSDMGEETGQPVELCCAIGDEFVDGIPYEDIVGIAEDFIDSLGGFEKFAEWGFIR